MIGNSVSFLLKGGGLLEKFYNIVFDRLTHSRSQLDGSPQLVLHEVVLLLHIALLWVGQQACIQGHQSL